MEGTRVVRGPNWGLEDEDGGEGFAGTVISTRSGIIFGYGSNTCTVLWDSGERSLCRCGPAGFHDLRVLESGKVSTEPEADRQVQLKGVYPEAMVYPGPGWHYSYVEVGNGHPIRLFIPQDERELGKVIQGGPDDLHVTVEWTPPKGISHHQRVNEKDLVFTLTTVGTGGFYDPFELTVLDADDVFDARAESFVAKDRVSFKPGYPLKEWNQNGNLGRIGTVQGIGGKRNQLRVNFGQADFFVDHYLMKKLNKFSVDEIIQLKTDSISAEGFAILLGNNENFGGAIGQVIGIDPLDYNNLLVKFQEGHVDEAFIDTAIPYSLIELLPVNKEPSVIGAVSHLEAYFSAVGSGNLDVVKELNSGLDPDSMDEGGLTALQLASRSGHFEVVVWLLFEGGASLEKPNELGWRAVHYAAETDQADILEYLINGEAKFDCRTDGYQWSPLHIAFARGSRRCAELLIRCDRNVNVNINVQDKEGQTPVHLAVNYGFTALLKDIPPTVRIDLAVLDKKKRTVLHEAVLKNHYEIVRFLLGRLSGGEEGLEVRDGTGSTPFLLACRERNYGIVELLVQAGANVLAVEDNGHTGVIQAILSSKPITFPRREKTPRIFELYSLALMQPQAKIVENASLNSLLAYLLENGCPLEARNIRGKSATDYMAERKMLPKRG